MLVLFFRPLMRSRAGAVRAAAECMNSPQTRPRRLPAGMTGH